MAPSRTEKMKIAEKFKLFGDYWIPRIAIAVSDSYVGLGKVKAKLVLHNHKDKDQLFLVLRGCPDNQDLRPRCGSPGRRVPIIPRGVWLMPVADDEAYLVLLEKKTTMNTGEVQMRGRPPDRWFFILGALLIGNAASDDWTRPLCYNYVCLSDSSASSSLVT